MTAVIDYGAGNLRSVENALNHIGVKCVVTNDFNEISNADNVILPGVGAFPDAVASLKRTGLFDFIKEIALSGKPLLGVCLGMQLLFEKSSEFSLTEGLGLIPGEVILMKPGENLKIPHMGWNSMEFNIKDEILNGVNNGEYVYFVHSYRAETNTENVITYVSYGSEKIPALVKCASCNVYGAQFHPEKSHRVGLKLLENFVKMR